MKQQKIELNPQMEVEFFGKSVYGARKNQEDSWGTKTQGESLLLVVCDGMGGHGNGDAASSLAVKTFLKEIQGNEENPEEAMMDLAEKIDQELSKNYGKNTGPGTTLVSAILKEKVFHWISIGDSKVYLWREGKLSSLATEHNYQTLLNHRYLKGELSKEGFLIESKKGERLTSYLGQGGLKYIDYSRIPLSLVDGDLLLLSSDGLSKALTEEEIAEILNRDLEGDEIIMNLLEKVAIKAGEKQDNTTLILTKITRCQS